MELPYGETGNDFDQIVLRRVVSVVDQAWILPRSQTLSIEHGEQSSHPHMDPPQLRAPEIAANTMMTWRRNILEHEPVLISLFLRSPTVQSVGETTFDYA